MRAEKPSVGGAARAPHCIYYEWVEDIYWALRLSARALKVALGKIERRFVCVQKESCGIDSGGKFRWTLDSVHPGTWVSYGTLS